ncbi:hypothetical protein [Tissierella praeacuta]|uniref:hypothetical protein n=1 Tax=Tissierella praeacuta TaxID=43131 RepID=UPI0028A8BB58|nr:hypothetical protein [Tissierella praeacuta]
MDEYNMFGEILENKKAVYMSVGDIPLGIYWLDDIDCEKLKKGILKCNYYFLAGKYSNLKRITPQLEIRIFKYEVYPIELSEIRKFAIQKEHNFDLIHSVCYWATQEAMAIKAESDRIGINMEDIENFKIKCIENESQSILNMETLHDYLKNSKKLCIKDLKNVAFVTPYDGNGRFGKKHEDINLFDTEMDVEKDKVVKSLLNNPKYENMLNYILNNADKKD